MQKFPTVDWDVEATACPIRDVGNGAGQPSGRSQLPLDPKVKTIWIPSAVPAHCWHMTAWHLSCPSKYMPFKPIAIQHGSQYSCAVLSLIEIFDERQKNCPAVMPRWAGTLKGEPNGLDLKLLQISHHDLGSRDHLEVSVTSCLSAPAATYFLCYSTTAHIIKEV